MSIEINGLHTMFAKGKAEAIETHRAFRREGRQGA